MFLVKNSKSPNYQVVYFIDGKRTTVSTRTSNKEIAEHFLSSFQKKIIIPTKAQPTQRIEQQKVILLSQFKDEYIQHIKPTISAAYLRSIKLSFSQFEKALGDIQLTEIDMRKIDNFITSTFARTKRGAHLYYRTLKAAFTKAVAWGYIEENIFKKIKFPRVPKKHPVFITFEELKVIISLTQEQVLKDLFTTAFYTGMRQGEIVNMQWNWIDFNNEVIQTKCSDEFQTKSKKERIIPINDNLKSVLLSIKYRTKYNSSTNYVFTNSKGIKLTQDYVTKKFKKASRKSGLNDEIHFHTLRHSFASNLVQKGVSLYVVKELLGHENISTTQIYSHLQSENLREAVGLL